MAPEGHFHGWVYVGDAAGTSAWGPGRYSSIEPNLQSIPRGEDPFLEAYQSALIESMKVVMERGGDGRNEVVSLRDMFLEDPAFPVHYAYMKACRALGELQAENVGEALDSIRDGINYFAFALALINLQLHEQKEDRA